MDGPGGGGKIPRQGGSSRPHPYRKEPPRQGPPPDEKIENKLYIGNLDRRVTEHHIIRMFNPFGKIKREEYLWHTHGPKRGEPRGYAFVEYSTREEAERAKAEMNGRQACGRPLVVRFVDEKVVTYNESAPVWTRDSEPKVEPKVAAQTNLSKSAKIAAIQKKLRMMEKEDKLKKSVNGVPSTSEAPYGSQTSSRPLSSVGDRRSAGEGDSEQKAPQSRTLLTAGHRWSGNYG